MAQNKSWFVYVLRCADGTFYTGSTTDMIRRLAEHNGKGKRGAKYTRHRRPVTPILILPCVDRSRAQKLEANWKKMSHRAKEHMLFDPPKHVKSSR